MLGGCTSELMPFARLLADDEEASKKRDDHHIHSRTPRLRDERERNSTGEAVFKEAREIELNR